MTSRRPTGGQKNSAERLSETVDEGFTWWRRRAAVLTIGFILFMLVSSILGPTAIWLGQPVVDYFQRVDRAMALVHKHQVYFAHHCQWHRDRAADDKPFDCVALHLD